MAIEIQNLQKSFGEKEVLKGIDIVFEQGKINMIIGASGSGKSVMLKCIVGLLKPSGGQVMYDGMDFHRANHKEVRNFRKNMGMLFQYSALFDSMTVEENVAFPLTLFTKYTKKAIKKRVEFCLDRVTMAGTNNMLPAELSGGMKKRVGIARAIALNPKYLFVDEPNSGLDPLTAAVIDELIKEITYEYNMCTVVVSHDMNSVVNISDNIMFLYKGLKEWEGDKRAILRSGNDNVDKFVFVSDLIRRDIYDDEQEKKEKGFDKGKPAVEAKVDAAKAKADQARQEAAARAEAKVKAEEARKKAEQAKKAAAAKADEAKAKAEEVKQKAEQAKKAAAAKVDEAKAKAAEVKQKEAASSEAEKKDLKDKLSKTTDAKDSPETQTPPARKPKPRARDPRHRGTRRDPRRRPPKK